MGRTVILGGSRTAFGKLGGALADKSAVELGAIAATAAMERSGVEPGEIDHVIMGQVVQAGGGMNPARQVGFKIGLDREVTADTINKVCGSGMRAVTMADIFIRSGEYTTVLAGGMESMTNAPYALDKARYGYRMGDGQIMDLMIHDGLTDAVMGCHMGIHGSHVAAENECSREEQDRYAFRSHQQVIAGYEAGTLQEEIVPIELRDRRGNVTGVFNQDESPRADTTLEALARLKPAFDPSGSVTAGNAPPVNDGGAALIVTSEENAKAKGVKPLATIIAHGTSAWDVPYLAYVPEMAARDALKKAGMELDEIDLIEINEAFASVAIISCARLGIDPYDKVNPNGGAIAIGHPVGASGARLILTLAHELRRRGGGYGLAAICSGLAQGDAIVIKVDAT
jgi:acetyl-CoA C-acetyltransferase